MVPSRRVLPWLAVALVGCGDSQSASPASSAASATSSSSASAAPAPSSPLTMNGQAVPIASWLAYSRGGRALQLVASTHRMGCDDLSSAGIKREAGEITVDLTVAPLLKSDGSERWRVGRARLGMVTRRGDFGAAEIETGDNKRPRLDEPLVLDASIPFPVPGQALQKLTLKGPIEATNCGTKPLLGEPTVLPQNDLEAEVATKKVVFRGASYLVEKKELHLSTQPHGCAARAGSDLLVTLSLDGEKASRVRIDGFAVPRLIGGTVEGLTAKPKEEAPEGRSSFEVEGDVKVGGYPLKLKGTVVAETCGPD